LERKAFACRSGRRKKTYNGNGYLRYGFRENKEESGKEKKKKKKKKAKIVHSKTQR
jgi:hypothetical protein